MTTSSPLLKITGLNKSYSGQKILDDFSLTIFDGEFFTLLGPSGCGKTTVLRMIGGFEEADSGQIFLDDKDISVLSAVNRPINTVFQSYALFPHMSVFDNVAFGLKMSKVKPDEIKQRVIEALEMVQLQDFAQRKPHQLSGGQQQRVAIARAVVNRPRLLLLDESLSALDYKLRQKMQVELKRLQRKLKISFVYVTHDQEEALSMSDRILIMDKGQVQQLGTPREIYESPANLFVARFIGEINQFDAKVVRRIDEDHVEVEAEGAIWVVKTQLPFADGDNAHVLLRPEDLRVVTLEQAEGHIHVTGTVCERNYKGKTLDSYIRLPSGVEILASEFFDDNDPDFDYDLEQEVAVQWVTGWEVVLPCEKSALAKEVAS